MRCHFRGVASVITVLGTICLSSCGGREVKPTEVESSLKKAVPIGTRHERVSELLDSLGIEHSPYDTSARRILAIKRSTKSNMTTRTDVQVIFTFDSSGVLAAVRTAEVLTGP